MKKRTSALVLLVIFAAIAASHATAGPQRTREDCVPYDASKLQLLDRGSSGWLISRDDGAMFIWTDTREDADIMLKVFKGHTAFCYVGRDNKRPNRGQYVSHYWK